MALEQLFYLYQVALWFLFFFRGPSELGSSELGDFLVPHVYVFVQAFDDLIILLVQPSAFLQLIH